jgi:hypothetical protein
MGGPETVPVGKAMTQTQSNVCDSKLSHLGGSPQFKLLSHCDTIVSLGNTVPKGNTTANCLILKEVELAKDLP